MKIINWKTLWGMVGLLALAAIFLRIAGLIGSIWMGFAVIAIVIIGIAIQMLPVYRRTVSLIFVIWIIVVLGIPTFNFLFQKTAPLTFDATERRKVWGDLVASEKMRPNALQEVLAFKGFVDGIEGEKAKTLSGYFDSLAERYQKGEVSLELLQKFAKASQVKIERDEKWRRENSKFIQKIGPPPKDPFWKRAKEWLAGLIPDKPKDETGKKTAKTTPALKSSHAKAHAKAMVAENDSGTVLLDTSYKLAPGEKMYAYFTGGSIPDSLKWVFVFERGGRQTFEWKSKTAQYARNDASDENMRVFIRAPVGVSLKDFAFKPASTVAMASPSSPTNEDCFLDH